MPDDSDAGEKIIVKKTAPAKKQDVAVNAEQYIEPPQEPKPDIEKEDKSNTETRKSRHLFKFVCLFAVLLLIVFLGFRFWRSRSGNNDSEIAQKVMQITEVPANEKPVITTITDNSKLTQKFLAEAQNGDKLLIYPNVKKAVLFRPGSGKIVGIAPIENTPPTLFLRNGTKQADMQPVVDKLEKAPEQYRLLSRDSSKKEYNKTIVVDLNGLRKAEAEQLANTLGATVQSLPADEPKPEGDLLIIVGSDQLNQ